MEKAKVGNTVQPSRPTQKFLWFFTLNNWVKNDITHLKMRFNKMCKEWIFEEEVGESGTPHLQGQIKLKVKLRLSSLKKWDPRIHWEPTRNREAAIDYCRKETKQYTNMSFDTFTEYDDIKWRPWQNVVIENVEVPCSDDRKINWVWDSTGNTGKSFLTKYLMKVENALVVDGKKADIFHQIAKRCEEGVKIGTVIIDVPRAACGKISYAAIESIKNGYVSSGKYEGGQYSFEIPHIYVFANELPEYKKFSLDRWDVTNLKYTCVGPGSSRRGDEAPGRRTNKQTKD